MLLFQFIGERWFRTEAVMAAVLFPKNDGITGIVSIFISLSSSETKSLESLHTASFNRIMLIPACAQTNVAV
jgi:hypothetical protein